MLLVVDVGNTHTVFGVFERDVLRHRFRLGTELRRTADEYALLVATALERAGIRRERIGGTAMASVVPPLTELFVQVCEEVLGHRPLVVGPGVRTGVEILYDNPKEVGADRIVNAVAGYARYGKTPQGPKGLIIVDVGTATTFDVVTPKGQYLGGAIAPGLAIATEALYRSAAKLPRVELVAPPRAVGKSTVTSMQSGIVYGYVELVDGMVRRMCRELQFSPRVVATGGAAWLVADHAATVEEVDEDLTLQGLRLVYERHLGEGR